MSQPGASARSRTPLSRLRPGVPFVLAALIGSVALSACGKPVVDPTGYFGQTADRLAYIEWTRTQDKTTGEYELAGSATLALVDATTNQIAADTASLTGTLNGKAVTLKLAKALDSSTSWQGTLNGAALTLAYTDGTGAVVTLSMRTATRPVFNAALVKQQEGLQTQQEGVTTQAGESKDQASVDKWSNTVNKDLAKLSKDVDATTAAVDAVNAAANAAGSEASLAQHYKSEALGHKYADAVCSFADQSSAAANSASAEAGAAASAQSDVDSLAAVVRQDITVLANDHGKLGQAQAAVPDYKPKGMPSDKAIDDAISSANSSITDAQHSANGASSAAGRKATTAQNDAAQAQSACANAPARQSPSPKRTRKR